MSKPRVIRVLSCMGCPYSNIYRQTVEGKNLEGICCSKQQNKKVESDQIDSDCPLPELDDKTFVS